MSEDKTNGVDIDLGSPGYVMTQKVTTTMTVPEILDPSDIAKELRDREDFVARQPLVRSISDNQPAADILGHLLKEVSEELSHLKWERHKLAKEGKSTAGISLSRVSSLRKFADILMRKMENARAEQLDLSSPRFKAVLKLWMEFLYESMQKANVQDQVIDLVFRQMEADMKDWEKLVSDSI